MLSHMNRAAPAEGMRKVSGIAIEEHPVFTQIRLPDAP
jgi:hypothetical protein